MLSVKSDDIQVKTKIIKKSSTRVHNEEAQNQITDMRFKQEKILRKLQRDDVRADERAKNVCVSS